MKMPETKRKAPTSSTTLRKKRTLPTTTKEIETIPITTTNTNTTSDTDPHDEEEEEVLLTTDAFTLHFDDSVASSLESSIARVNSSEYQKTTATCSDTLLQTMTLTINNNEISDFTTLNAANLKQRLIQPWHTLQKEYTVSQNALSPLQESLFPNMNTYKDLQFNNQTPENTQELRDIYCLHAINHVYKTRDRILKNTLKIKQETLSGSANITEVRDQGFTRPRVLILAPFKNDALEIINTIMKISGTTIHENKKRFDDEFGIEAEDDIVDQKKPLDYKQMFKGNIDDCFRIGMRFARKNLKLYSDFYSSDILVCSPLGLRMIIGDSSDKKRDYDFLSSVEMVIMDKTNVFLMQNWDHVEHIFDHLNLIPKTPHDTDFSRIKSWYLDSKSKHLRQTLMFTSFATPQLNALMSSCKNIAGKTKVTHSIERGSITKVHAVLPQLFQRIECALPSDSSDSRFAYFCTHFLVNLIKMKQTLLFVPSYFDYIRVRNYMQSQRYEFVGLSEYSTNVDVSRARLRFFKGEVPILIVTERFHFFKRYVIRGARHVVFYQVPENARFYDEIVNGVDVEGAERRGEGSSVSVFWNVYDGIALERVVGKDRIKKLFEMKKSAFVFTA